MKTQIYYKEQNSLFPELEDEYIKKSVERVKNAYYQHQSITTDKMYLAFSGGKDSICLFYVALTAFNEIGVKMEDVCDVGYSLTSVDPPELIYFIRDFQKLFPFIKIEYPKLNMFQLIRSHHILPTRTKRFCCVELKELYGNRGFTLTGVRWAESKKRKEQRQTYESANHIIKTNDNSEMRKTTEFCMQNKRYYCNPIIDWSDVDVWRYIKKNNLPYCKLYDEGFKRLGCIGCPLSSTRCRELEFKRYPKYKDLYMREIKALAQYNAENKNQAFLTDPEIIYKWWMGYISAPAKNNENKLFE